MPDGRMPETVLELVGGLGHRLAVAVVILIGQIPHRVEQIRMQLTRFGHGVGARYAARSPVR
jgi:hypothetical protein